MIIVTLYQASSLNEMMKEVSGMKAEDKFQTNLNMTATVSIIGFLVYSFLI